MHQRAALRAREDHRVQLLRDLVVRPGEDDAATVEHAGLAVGGLLVHLVLYAHDGDDDVLLDEQRADEKSKAGDAAEHGEHAVLAAVRGAEREEAELQSAAADEAELRALPSHGTLAGISSDAGQDNTETSIAFLQEHRPFCPPTTILCSARNLWFLQAPNHPGELHIHKNV